MGRKGKSRLSGNFQVDNDELRAKTEELKKFIKDSAAEENKKIEELKATIESTDLEKREAIFSQIDKLEKEVLEKYRKHLVKCCRLLFLL